MATPLRGLVESAFATYLTGAITSTPCNIYAGMATGTKEPPCVICKAESGEEDPVQSGNYRVEVSVTAKGMAADGVEAFDTLCDAVREALSVDGLHDTLAAQVTGLAVWGIASEFKMEWDTDEDALTERTVFEVYCAAASLT